MIPHFLHNRTNRVILCIAIILWCWNGLTQSMFVDGLTYATISRNMAEGDGSFWHPHYWNHSFYGHPPLFFWLESWLFRWFGDSMYIEKSVSLLFSLSIFFSIPTLWKWTKQPEEQVWLPLLLWALSPLVVWSSLNHLLELPMTFLCIWSVGFWYRYQDNYAIKWGILSGIFILMAVFIKGPVALFPVLWPWMNQSKWEIKSRFFLAQLIPFMIAAVYFLLNQDAQSYIQQYIHQQLFSSIQNNQSREQFLLFWIQIMIPWTLLILILSNKKEIFKQKIKTHPILWISLVCSIPMIISGKQHDYYLLPFLPWTAIGFSATFNPVIPKRTIPQLGAFIIQMLLLITLYFRWGIPGKDAEILNMMHDFSTKVPNNCRIGYEGTLAEDWTLIAYGLRYHRWWNRGISDCDWIIGLAPQKGSSKSGKYYLKKVTLQHE